MTTLTRQPYKVFAQNANLDQLAVYGSMKTGTPVYSSSIATLQGETAYGLGWADAILDDKAPYLEEMNGLQYSSSYQIGYMLQEGIPAYDSATEYSNTSIVKVINNNELQLYHSLQNSNVGHALSEPEWWTQVYFTNTAAIGVPQLTLAFNTLPPNCVWLEGATVSRTTYASLFAIYGTTYGAGDGSTTFKLPDLRNRVFWGGTTAGYLGAGFPSLTSTTASAGAHTHTRGTMEIAGSFWDLASTGYQDGNYMGSADGAFYTNARGSGNASHKASSVTKLSDGHDGIGFRASRNWTGSTSSSGAHTHAVTISDGYGILGAATTVRPPAVKVRIYTRYA